MRGIKMARRHYFMHVVKAFLPLCDCCYRGGADASLKDNYDETAVEHSKDARTEFVFLDTIRAKTPASSRSCKSEGSDISTISKATSLPFVELLNVFRFLDVKDICRAACVCGKWHRASETEDLWSRLGVRRWECALRSSMGFGPAPAMSMFRPSGKSSGSSRSGKGSKTTTAVVAK